IPMLLYEAGEALRFDEVSIRAGVRGVSRVMRELGMLPKRKTARSRINPVQSGETTWVRAPGSGIVRTSCRLGERVRAGQVLATVSDPFGEVEIEIPATASGIVIGRSMSPLAHEGDALFHLARFEDVSDAAQTVDEFHEAHGVDENWG
ncbi:MAG: succinylglutamate desuccinylase, partial [Gammaproteobacteria bacterium]|nr:succinylglutamate desuccinylase [Gammaproteobacteria bacterium]